MKKRSDRMVPIGTLLVFAMAVTLFLVPSAMAENGKATISVNINTADMDELTSLPGIGSSKANAIVNYRSEHGSFTTVDELTNVQGIGSNVLEKIRIFITTQ